MRSLILVIHICAGVLGVLSGAAAMSFRKGSRRHLVAGTVFVISMLGLAATAACLGNVGGGILTFYLVTTAWLTARRRDGGTGIFDWGAMLVALAFGAATVIKGIEVAGSPTRSLNGVPFGMFFFLGSVTLLAAAGDIRMLTRGGVSNTQRITRHLWRMCFAFFIATGSFFIGQPQVFPAALRKTNALFLPGVLPLVLLIVWLFRVRFTKASQRESAPGSGGAHSVPT